MNKTTSLSLLSRLRRGNQQAWAEMVQWYLPLVYHWGLQAGLERETAADISQEVFLKVSMKIDQIRRTADSGSFRGWLRVTTRRTIIDWLRGPGQEVLGTGGTTAQELMQQIDMDDSWEGLTAEDEELLDRIDEFRGEFEETTWKAFWLTTFDGLSGEEAAKKLGIKRGAVYQAKSRVMKKLRRELG